MSRHKFVKKINLADELDDDALSDGGEDDLTPEQKTNTEEGLKRVRAAIGSQDESGLEDAVIKDALWNFYWDVETVIQWLLENQIRKHATIERKESITNKKLPPLPSGYQEHGDDVDLNRGFTTAGHKLDMDERPPSGYLEYEDEDDFYQDIPLSARGFGTAGHELDVDERPRIPLIVLAQQGQHPPPELSDEGVMPTRYRLSTITEKTERTEASRHWPSKQQLYALNDPQPSSPLSTNTSYGQVIDNGNQSQFATDYQIDIPMPVNPNEIPPSPSPSAQLRLSHYEPAPSVATSESRSSSTTLPRTPPLPLPPMEAIPDIPDYGSKSTARPVAPVPPSTSGSARQSKLSVLASSRVSSATKSSRTHQPLDTASVVTYPALRPSPESEKSLKSASITSSASTAKARPRPVAPTSPPRSSTSSHVRRAIQTALELEAGDRDQSSQAVSRNLPALSTSSSKSSSDRSLSQRSPSAPNPVTPTDSHIKGRPSKLALLAQAKASANAYQGPWMPTVKTNKSPVRKLPESRTEYLIPVANGPTATTAITTSYQSLHSLKSPYAMIPALPMVPIDGPRSPQTSTSPNEPRRSKLAMKIKRAHEKPNQESSPVAEDSGFFPDMPPMFSPKATRSRASPSAFASLLLDDHLMPLTSEGKNVDKDKGKRREDARHVGSAGSPIDVMDKPKHRKHSRRQSLESPTERFAFDIPSPDDIVLNARRGTSLSQHR